ncbi:MAG: hypothetical protein D6689_13290 [Deltaproteobacteria bacterium]|nr:MAG: hypothetical protein D6689_13290 [Deltaproteobacteria bacterium]
MAISPPRVEIARGTPPGGPGATAGPRAATRTAARAGVGARADGAGRAASTGGAASGKSRLAELRARGWGDDAEQFVALLSRIAQRASRHRRGDDVDPAGDRGAAEAAAAAGPLAHQRAAISAPPVAAAPTPATVPVREVADRILAGFDPAGRPTARIDLALGTLAGSHVDIVSGPRGIELTVVAATAAARHVVEAKLSELADALARRGLRVARLRVATARRPPRQTPHR